MSRYAAFQTLKLLERTIGLMQAIRAQTTEGSSVNFNQQWVYELRKLQDRVREELKEWEDKD